MRKIQLYPVNHEYMKNGRKEKDIPVIVDLWERRKMSGWTVYFEFGEPMKWGIKWKGIIEQIEGVYGRKVDESIDIERRKRIDGKKEFEKNEFD